MVTELYRYRGQGDANYMHLKLVKDVFPIIKTTPWGYWIDVSSLEYIKGQINTKKQKWVSNDTSIGVKKFAFETEDRAMINFLARKDKQLRLLKSQKSQAKAERDMILALIKDKNVKLPPRLSRRYHAVAI